MAATGGVGLSEYAAVGLAVLSEEKKKGRQEDKETRSNRVRFLSPLLLLFLSFSYEQVNYVRIKIRSAAPAPTATERV